MDKISMQSIFDAAWEEFIVKGAPPSVKPGSQGIYDCVYRGPNGSKCVFGLVLPDHIAEKWEGATAMDIMNAYPELFETHLFLPMSKLQLRLHDQLVDHQTGRWILPLEERKQRYIKVAKDYGLSVPVSA